MRNVALFASQRSGSDFNKYWPEVGKSGGPDEIVMTEEMRATIRRIHSVKE